MHDIDKENYQAKSMIHYMENNKMKERKVTKVMKIKVELESLENGQSLVKKDLVKKYWNCSSWADVDEFVIRSFDVAFLHSKKLMPEMKFKTLKGLITRIA